MSPSTKTSMTVQVNGQSIPLPGPVSLLDLLAQQNLNPRLIAIEYNGEILHRQFWSEQRIQAGDRLEIVTIVGGG